VVKLKDDCGMWITHQINIANKFISNYSDRFSSMHRGARHFTDVSLRHAVSDSNNMELVTLPDKEEVRQALFAIDSNKTPGPDGFGAGFFKHYWYLIHEDLYQCIFEFFRNGRLLKQINHTFIALIPKIENPSQTHHFQPISLCSTVYKIIAKILVNRLRPLLSKIISPVQSTFVPGRSIHDNILITHEIMHKFKVLKGKTEWVALKLDMEKAYDRLECDFIEECLKRLGFHGKWIHWVMECIATVSY